MFQRTILLVVAATLARVASVAHGYEPHLQEHRALDQQMLINYEARTAVADYAAVDLDLQTINVELSKRSLMNAKTIYLEGGHSRMYASLTLTGMVADGSFPAGTLVEGKSDEGSLVTGVLVDKVEWTGAPAEVSIKVLYDISDMQQTLNSCHVGGLWKLGSADRSGCFTGEGSIDLTKKVEDIAVTQSFNYKYNIRDDNNSDRTLEKLSVHMGGKNKSNRNPNLQYYPLFQQAFDYYGDTNYAGKFILAALDGTGTAFSSGKGNAAFDQLDFRDGRIKAVSKGLVTITMWMNIVTELEFALDRCNSLDNCTPGDTDCFEAGEMAWDRAVAYYTGSLAADQTDAGVFMYQLANENAALFKTAGPGGDSLDGEAFVNAEIFREFQRGQDALRTVQCDDVRRSKDTILQLMKVPLIQGALKHTYTRAFEYPEYDDQDMEQEDALAATYAAAVLPFVNSCSDGAAETIYENLRIGSQAKDVNFARVKEAFERTYDCMQVSCREIGGIHGPDGYREGAAPCRGGGDGGGGSAGIVLGVICVCLGVAVVFALKYYRRKNAMTMDMDTKTMSAPAPTIEEVTEIL